MKKWLVVLCFTFFGTANVQAADRLVAYGSGFTWTQALMEAQDRCELKMDRYIQQCLRVGGVANFLNPRCQYAGSYQDGLGYHTAIYENFAVCRR